VDADFAVLSFGVLFREIRSSLIAPPASICPAVSEAYLTIVLLLAVLFACDGSSVAIFNVLSGESH